VLADKFEGKRLNSPNDIVVHPDGGIWFTDPPYGINGNYEGYRAEKEVKEAVYRIDPKTARVVKVTDEVVAPSGICFSPDYKRLYVADTGARETKVWDVGDNRVIGGKLFIKLDVPGTGAPSGFDGIRCDTDGNVWGGARPGVQIITPTGERIGMIRLPENCANVCFGGQRRNRLFMTASQSLYALYVQATGAHIASGTANSCMTCHALPAPLPHSRVRARRSNRRGSQCSTECTSWPRSLSQ
jgi:gluconolactonase